MRRAIAVIVALSLIVGLSPGLAGAQEQCQDPSGNQTELCERINELEEENSRLSAENTDLASDNEELRYELENSGGGFPDPMTRRMNQTGAWDPQGDQPALLISRETGFFPIVYQYVGPGNGDHSFNGRNAWTEVARAQAAEEEIRGEGTFTFSIEYANPGMNTTYTAQSMGEYRRTIQELQQEMNTPEGYTSYTHWTNEKRQDAESTGSWVWWTVALGMVGVFWGGLKYESVNQPMQRRREEERNERVGGQMNAFGGTISTKEQLLYYGEKYRVPIVLVTAAVVGWVVL